MRRYLIISIFFLIPLFAQDVKEIVVEGEGSIVQNDIAKARDNAIDEALRNAVEQAVGLLISSETIAKNFMILDDRIYSRSAGYVSSYSIITEGKLDEYRYRVKIKAQVKTGMLKDDLAAIGLLLRRKNLPRMMVIIQENNIGAASGSVFDVNMNTAEDIVMETFMSKGFSFVDESAVKAKVKKSVAIAAISGDVKAAKSLGMMAKAEVLIVGKAMANVASGVEKILGNMKSCQADVNLRAIDVSSGEVIAVASKHAAAVHIDELSGGTEAIKKATKLASTELINKILSKWSQEESGAQKIELNVYGFRSFDDAYTFKNEFSTVIRGVKGIYSHGFQAGSAIYEVEYEGNSENLVMELIRKGLPHFIIEVKEQSPSKIVLKVNSKGE
ncbi:hypothetical protein J7L85_00910 [candidate division WOR-3 bacterium]|nr:hypothetical protein [candidate division WOR-3 bacterium]